MQLETPRLRRSLLLVAATTLAIGSIVAADWLVSPSPKGTPMSYSMLGETAWHASCPIPETEGLCIRFAAPPAGVLRCHADRAHLAVIARDRTLVADAFVILSGSIATLDRSRAHRLALDQQLALGLTATTSAGYARCNHERLALAPE